ncbi:IclR family transcriptional regulator [Georgenia sp. TF02-10]|uniref:IclR family transcriptional regulator n=1 Tax=Georgenia sp. TF02-10 TaxID=2917725 RepID=UPI001FA6EBF3|nr:IclR family transcriptional regulator [Georgenia sp. TF02-10]UNX55067.1 IclR family transcriptional regulator [Georgenia sp. TF02-10]
MTGRDMVGKALELLTLLGEDPDGATLSELSRRSGFPTSTAHRLLATLLQEDFVRLDPQTKRYSLGLRLYQLGATVSARRGLGGVALPLLRTLSRRTGEASLMSVLDGEHQLYVHHIEGSHGVGVKGETGTLGPLHCTAMGKCLVAFADRETRAHLVEHLELTRFTDRTITDRARFRAEIAAVRKAGFAVVDEEHEQGVRTIGVPVLGADGTALASLSVPAPAYRLQVRDLLGFLPALREAAAELAVLLPQR